MRLHRSFEIQSGVVIACFMFLASAFGFWCGQLNAPRGWRTNLSRVELGSYAPEETFMPDCNCITMVSRLLAEHHLLRRQKGEINLALVRLKAARPGAAQHLAQLFEQFAVLADGLSTAKFVDEAVEGCCTRRKPERLLPRVQGLTAEHKVLCLLAQALSRSAEAVAAGNVQAQAAGICLGEAFLDALAHYLDSDGKLIFELLEALELQQHEVRGMGLLLEQPRSSHPSEV